MTTPNESTESHSPAFIHYGQLLKHWRNEVKVPFDVVANATGIAVDRIKMLESGADRPTLEELEKFAEVYVVSVRDLMPSTNDLDRGIKILRHPDARVVQQERQVGVVQYTYWERVMTSMIPNFKPVELELHLHKRDEVVMNRGHFYHQYTQVLDGGPVATLWEKGGETHEEIFHKGDSFLIPGFVPHAFYSPDEQHNGRILAITFGQHLASGDARNEMELIGKDNLHRIVQDGDYYNVKR